MTTTIITTEARQVQTAGGIMNAGLVERFISFAGVSPKSAATYKTALRQLQKYFSELGVVTPAREDLVSWREKLLGEKKSPATIQLYLAATKVFFRWLSQEGVCANIADNLKAGVKINHEHKKDALSAAQAGKLIASIGTKEFRTKKNKVRKENPLKVKRDKAIVSLMTVTGLRCIEVVRARICDLVEEYGRVYLRVQGKGHSSADAKVLVPAQVVWLIQDYLGAPIRGDAGDTAPLFVSTSNRNKKLGKAMSPQTISKLVKSYLRGVGLDTPRLTAHSLRHTAATTMILAGVSLDSVQMVLRHTSIATTMIYNNAVNRMKNTAEQTASDLIFATV